MDRYRRGHVMCRGLGYLDLSQVISVIMVFNICRHPTYLYGWLGTDMLSQDFDLLRSRSREVVRYTFKNNSKALQ